MPAPVYLSSTPLRAAAGPAPQARPSPPAPLLCAAAAHGGKMEAAHRPATPRPAPPGHAPRRLPGDPPRPRPQRFAQWRRGNALTSPGSHPSRTPAASIRVAGIGYQRGGAV